MFTKKLYMILSVIFIVFGGGGFLFWAFFIAESQNGVIPVKGNEPIILYLLDVMFTWNDYNWDHYLSFKEEGNKVSKKAVLSGLGIAVAFFLWRLAVAL